MARSAPVRVMVVDDQADARYLVRLFFEDHDDLEVVAEADGAAAALRAMEAAPEVALLDARMPRVSGYELAPQLRERDPSLRVVLLTAIVDDHVRGLAADAGIERCVVKGDARALAAAVRELAGS